MTQIEHAENVIESRVHGWPGSIPASGVACNHVDHDET